MVRQIYSILRLALLLCLASTGNAQSQDRQIRLLFFSSYPEIMQEDGKPTLAHLAAAVAEEQAANQETYLVYGGAAFGPSLLGVLDRGAHMVDILNSIQPEFMGIMKREFSYGLDHLILNASVCAFPLVTSNLIDARSSRMLDGTEPYYLLEGGDLSVGFIVLTSYNAIAEYGALDAKSVDMDSTVNNYTKELRDLGADAVFLIGDTDYDDLSRYREAGLVDGIFYTHNFGNPTSLDHQGTLHQEGPLDGKLIALDLILDETGTLTSSASFIDLLDVEPDPVIASLITSYRARLDARLSPTIAELGTSFNTMRQNVRTKENAFGSFAADALRSYVETDVFLLNSGAIRGNRSYTAGTMINRGDIQRELPFGNRTAVIKLSGATLQKTLEYGIDCSLRADGCALQVSNLTMRYNRDAPYGLRITEITVGGAPLEPGTIYTVGLSDFLAAGNDGFDWLADAERVPSNNGGRTMWDLIALYSEQAGTIYPRTDGRIIDEAEAN